jgi:uncharacterized protein (DUF2062 family)
VLVENLVCDVVITAALFAGARVLVQLPISWWLRRRQRRREEQRALALTRIEHEAHLRVWLAKRRAP